VRSMCLRGSTIVGRNSEALPGIDVAAFKTAYYPVVEEFISDGRLDAIPNENYEALDELTALGKAVMLLTPRTHGELKHMLAPDHPLAPRVKAFYYRGNMQSINLTRVLLMSC
jgi:phosphoglycolate phosphatase